MKKQIEKTIKAYKVFNPDWTCRGFQYEIGKTYSIKEEPIMCERGFHACIKVQDCFSYYSFDTNNKVAEVTLFGIILGEDGDKQCSQKITINKELSWNEMLSLANSGKGNTGMGNSGSSNSGNSNSGSSNSGDRNSGYFNSTTPEYINCFNKPCKTADWDNALKPNFIYKLNLTKWIWWSEMTDKEKADNKNAFVCEGYLKALEYKEAWAEAYETATEEDIDLLKSLPNWNANVFEEITGIKIK